MAETLEELQRRYPGAACSSFGDSRELSDRLLSLILSGKKVATCSALRDHDATDGPLPQARDRGIVLSWDDEPVVVTELTEVTTRRFCDVDPDFALAEGENETLEGWRVDHRAFFERNGGFSPEMVLVCERFRVIEVVGE
ncbi:MAG: ASCH domain-containing protein [Planctomycetota bacterium]